MNEDDALGGEEHSWPQADGSGTQSVEVFAGFFGHRQVVRENEGNVTREVDFPDVASFPTQVEERVGRSFLEEMLEGGLGDGDAAVDFTLLAQIETLADPQRVLDHSSDAALIESIERTEIATVNAKCFGRLRPSLHDDTDRRGFTEMIGIEERVGDAGGDDLHMACSRQVVKREARSGRCLSGS